MKRKLIVRRRAESQAFHARDWYQSQLDGLGHRFVDELDKAIRKAHQNPLHYQAVHREFRRVLLRRFPYAVFFIAEEERVVVLSILHQYEDPEKWQLVVGLIDGRRIAVPLTWFPRLLHASTQQRSEFELIGDGEGIHWPDVDEDISVRGLVLGYPSVEYRKGA